MKELFADFRKKDLASLCYHSVFVIRRQILVASIMFLWKYPLVQVFLNLFITGLALVYTAQYQPYKLPLLNKFEMFNEITVLLCSYHHLLFTNFVPNFKTRFQMGWSICGVLAINIFVNLGFIMGNSLVTLYSKAKRRVILYNLRKERDEKMKLRLQQAEERAKEA